MKLQIKFEIKNEETQKMVNRSKTFNNLNQEATNENLTKFAKAYMSMTDIDNFQVIKITSEKINEME